MLGKDVNPTESEKGMLQAFFQAEDLPAWYVIEIEKDKKFLDRMKDSNEVEKFAREKYYLKKEGEDIFIIEHEDSLK